MLIIFRFMNSMQMYLALDPKKRAIECQRSNYSDLQQTPGECMEIISLIAESIQLHVNNTTDLAKKIPPISCVTTVHLEATL